MPVIDLGDSYPVTIEILDVDEQPVDVDRVLLTVTLPSGVEDGPLELSRSAPGRYEYDYPTAVTGLHAWRAVAFGTVEGQWADVFTVQAAAPTSIISTDEATKFLAAQDVLVEPDQLEQARWFAKVASESVERDLGAVLAYRELTVHLDSGGGQAGLRLPKIPPRWADGGRVTIISVAESGVPLVEGTGWTLRRRDWRLLRGNGLAGQCWLPGIENVTVTYGAWCQPIPEIARKVALSGFQRMWQQSQQLPHSYSDDSQVLDVVVTTGVLTPLELSSYNSLRRARIA